MRVSPPRIQLNIDRIVLNGLAMDRRAAETLRQTIESELSVYLASPGAADRLASLSTAYSVPSPNVDAGPHPDPTALGRSVAGSIAAALGMTDPVGRRVP